MTMAPEVRKELNKIAATLQIIATNKVKTSVESQAVFLTGELLADLATSPLAPIGVVAILKGHYGP